MLRIWLVGEVRVEVDGRRLEAIASRRARSLLAWLAYHPGLHPRSRVATVFWPDVLESSARASLRTTLATLRRDLGEEAARHLAAERADIGIVDGPDVWIDVREIGRLAPAEALALGDGELMSDLDDDWVLEARAEHRDRIAELLARAGDAAEAAGDTDAAATHARRRLELDPHSEDALRALMRRLARAGDRPAAVAAYEAFRATLRRDLGMAPSTELRALVDELRSARRSPTALPIPAALARSEHAPLAGRREELAALRDTWRRAATGAAAVAIVTGDAGSGKTRLLSELAAAVHAEGATVLAGRCMEDGVVAFAPFTEALRPYVAAERDALPEWVVTELARMLPELDPVAATPAGGLQDVRHRLFEAVAAAVGQAARATPVLLVTEDLHWADAATLQMLAHVVRTVGWAPLLVAGSMRDEGSAGALRELLGDLVRERRLARVRLGGLSEACVGELAAAWLQGAASPPELTAVVHRRTGGNPLFVEELVRHLVESHPAQPADALVGAAVGDVPEGVRAVIDRRLARLPEAAGQAVRVAAVAGEDIELAAVAAACAASDDEVAAGLDAAVAAGLVDASAQAGRYRFAHALIREAVIAGLTVTRRALLHRRLAQVLESHGEERLPEVARHLLDARPLVPADAAAGTALRAAEQALGRLAYEDAADLLERASAADLGDRDPLRAEILLALGDALQRSGDAPAAALRLREAAAAARTLGEPELLARAALASAGLTVKIGAVRADVRALLEEALAAIPETSPLRPRLQARLAIELYYAQPTALRERLSEEALTAARDVGGRAVLEALEARHVALWGPDHTEERFAIAAELSAAARAQGDREAQLQGANWRFVDLLELGRIDEARAAIADHERLAADLRLPAYAWYVPLWRASLALMAGRLDEAERLSEEGERIGRAAHDDNADLLFRIQRLAIRYAAGRLTDADYAAIVRGAEHSPARAAWRMWAADIAYERGDAERAADAVLAEVAGLPALPLDAEWLYTATVLGSLAARLGDAASVAVVYPRVLPYRDRVVTTGRAAACAGSAALPIGLMAAALGDRAAAAGHLEEAVRRNDALGAVIFAAAAREALARI